jgi:hypothetical protein
MLYSFVIYILEAQHKKLLITFLGLLVVKKNVISKLHIVKIFRAFV